MDPNIVLVLLRDAEYRRWADLVISKQEELAAWLISFHPQKDVVTCEVDPGYMGGDFNLGKKVTFSDGTKWFLRFPKLSRVSADHADEKVALEVRVLQLLAQETTIPVPKVQHWGRAADCPLGLGPFIIMDFVEGVPLSTLLISPGARFRAIKDGVPEDKIEQLYRQMAQILLQLFHLDLGLDRIRNIPPLMASVDLEVPVPARPLTFKAHEIFQDGGVDTFHDGMSRSTTEYFGRVLEQDWEQLISQEGSSSGEDNARGKYLALSALRFMLPTFVHPEYDRGPFRLVCDQLCPWNLIVRSADDLTVVGVVNLEWSYVGPAQLLASAPWWLLGMHLTEVDTYHDEDHQETADRYVRQLQLFKRVLEEEEGALATPEFSRSGEFSRLVDWSEASGAMWLHMLLLCGFNHPESLPFVQLLQRVGLETWEFLEDVFRDADAEAFAKAKAAEEEGYEKVVEEALKLKEQLRQGALTSEDYLSALESLLT